MTTRVFCLPEYSHSGRNRDVDQESNGSSMAEGMESPRLAVAGDKEKWKVIKTRKGHGYSQILRIREEDSYLREGIGEGNWMIGKFQFMLFSRPILPASPLSARTPHF